jgi:hypothetical protein
MNYLLPLIAATIGALLGLLSTLWVSSKRQRQDITLKLLDQYFEVRKEIVNVVSDLSNLKVKDDLNSAQRVEYRDLVSKLFYKHYDFLPKPVLDSMTLLYVCLSEPEGGPYIIRDGAVVAMNDSEVIRFIDDCSLFVNTKYLAPLALKSSNLTIKANQVIILHARQVLYTLNKFASIEDLLEMTKRLKKTADI